MWRKIARCQRLFTRNRHTDQYLHRYIHTYIIGTYIAPLRQEQSAEIYLQFDSDHPSSSKNLEWSNPYTTGLSRSSPKTLTKPRKINVFVKHSINVAINTGPLIKPLHLVTRLLITHPMLREVTYLINLNASTRTITSPPTLNPRTPSANP